MLLFSVIGGYSYFPLWHFTVHLMAYFSGGAIIFYGKYPFVIDWKFPLLFSLIPLCFYISYLSKFSTVKKIYWKSTLYLFLLVFVYIGDCYYKSWSIKNRYKSSDISDVFVSRIDILNVSDVDLLGIMFCALFISTIVLLWVNSLILCIRGRKLKR